MNSPDHNSLGFLSRAPNALRYENQSRDPDDVGAQLTSLISRPGRVLDVGCGTGSITELITELSSVDVVGIEPDPERVKSARSRGLVVYQGMLSEQFLEENGPFDTITFADVLEHLSNPGEIILLAKRGLTHKGAIVVSVPNVAHWSVRMQLLLGRFNYQDCGIMDATHLRWFTQASLHRFFDNLGFRITGHQYTLNTGMAEYRQMAPWRWLPASLRLQLARRLLRVFPRLLGCQHIVRVVVK